MEILQQTHWTTLINIILQRYFSELITTCIMWPKKFDFHLIPSTSQNVYLHINPLTLSSSFSQAFYNYTEQDERFNKNGVYYNDLIRKYIAAIEQTHCEGFLAFQDDIPKLAETFRKASSYSKWRSISSRFLFVYTKEYRTKDYFQDTFFKNQANILIIESDYMNSSIFSLKTNKFVGSIFQHPEELKELSSFNASNNTFIPPVDLFPPEKLQDLQGREIIVGAFDYRPFVAVDFNRLPQYYDHADYNPSHLVHVDGTEIRICHTFCEIFNCTVQFDTSEKADWGSAFSNFSGDGLVGMILDGKTHLGMGGMYTWYSSYAAMDLTTFIGRSGITCLVPAPTRLVSWTLPLRPFQFTLWLAVGMCLLLETMSLLVTRRFEQTLAHTNNSWWSCLQFGYITSLKLFISQSSNYIVNSHTVRTVLFACYMIDIIITNIYGGGLSSMLTVPILEETADSLQRLYEFNIPWTGTTYGWLASIETYEADSDSVYPRLVANFELNTFDEMREKSKTENMGFILERLAFGHFGNVEFLTPEALKRLKLMVDDIYSEFTVVIVPRMWAHLPKYNDFILAWHSSGFDKFWEWKITADYLNVNEQNQVQASMYTNFDAGPVVLDMENFAGLVIVWFLGMMLSTVVFLGEMLVAKIQQKLKKKIKE